VYRVLLFLKSGRVNRMWFQENDNELFMFRYQEAHFKLNEKNETHI